MAGYNEPMQKFLLSNPGLHTIQKSTIDFPDYSNAELAKIFIKNVEDAGCVLRDPQAVEAYLAGVFSTVQRKPAFGNARIVRNVPSVLGGRSVAERCRWTWEG